MIIKEFIELRRTLFSHKHSLIGYYEISTKCNFNCIHCYNQKSNCYEIPFEEYYNIVDFIKQSGVFTMVLTGGEFFSHPYYMSFLQYLTELRLEIIIYTNGSLIDLQLAKYLKQKGIKLEITIYGVSPRTYYSITGDGGNYYKTMDALSILDETGVSYKLKAVCINQNYNEVDQITDFISKHNGIKTNPQFVLFGHDSNIIKSRLSDERCINLIKQIKDIKSPSSKYGDCSAGITQFCIRSNGDIVPCVGWNNIIMGNVLSHTYEGIIKEFKTMDQLMMHDIKCNNCELVEFCNVCPMLFYQDSGSHLNYSTEQCRIAKLNYKVYKDRNGGD